MVNYNEWLREVNDDTLVSKLSIPGTHNAAACHTALPSVKCQGASVTDQLNNGVRFLDIRAAKQFLGLDEDKKVLQVIHGNFPVRIPFPLKLSSVLDEVYGFLNNHPSETVIVSIKQEGQATWDNANDEFANLIWEKYVQPKKDHWYLNTDSPKVGDARGKIILFRRFGVNNEERSREFGFDAASWSYNTIDDDRGSFCVQDFCEINDGEDVQKKLGYVKDFARKANEFNSTNGDNKLFVNFCSGSNFFNTECWPQKISQAIENGGLHDAFSRGVGIIVLDYAESNDYGLVRQLIDTNF